MPKFITIGYGDATGYGRTDPEVRDAAHRHDASLRAAGATMGTAGTPVQVRNPGGGGVEVTEGPFLSSVLPIAGFALMEAADMDEAVRLASQSPCAVAHGVIEVWPLDDGAG